MDVSPADRGYSGGGIIGGGKLCILMTEHTHTVHCDQVHDGPVSSGGQTPRNKGVQAVVVAVGPGLGGDAYVG